MIRPLKRSARRSILPLHRLARHSDAVQFVLLALSGRYVVNEGASWDYGYGRVADKLLTIGHILLGIRFGYLEDDEGEEMCRMSRTTTMTVRVSGTLSDFVAANVGEGGAYENVSEYIRDLIRRDRKRAESETFDRLRAELNRAFAAPEAGYKPLFAAEVIARNRT